MGAPAANFVADEWCLVHANAAPPPRIRAHNSCFQVRTRPETSPRSKSTIFVWRAADDYISTRPCLADVTRFESILLINFRQSRTFSGACKLVGRSSISGPQSWLRRVRPLDWNCPLHVESGRSECANPEDSEAEMALIAEMCDHREWSRRNARGFLLREKARPTLSTVGTRKVGRKPACGRCPMKPESCSSLSAEFWNVSAPPWSANGVIFPPTSSANCLSTRLRANCATLFYSEDPDRPFPARP